MAISAALDLVGRLGFGYLCDLQIFDRKKAFVVWYVIRTDQFPHWLRFSSCLIFNFFFLFFCSILGAGLAVLSIPFESHSYLVVFSSAAYGLCLGCWYLLIPVLLADFFGTESISSSYGLIRMFQSIGAISIPPLAGFLKDLTGGYETCFYCMGACMVLGSVPLLVLIIETNNNDANSTTAGDDSDVSTVTNSNTEKTASLKS